jgi:hypothetical protein
MRANIVKNLANSPLLPSIFALLARILILNLYRLELIEVPYRHRCKTPRYIIDLCLEKAYFLFLKEAL